MEVLNDLTQIVSDILDYVSNNKILNPLLGLILVLYASIAAPKLPKTVTIWFDNTWFKLVFMFLIAFMATKDQSVAIISSIALLVTLQSLSAQKTTDSVLEVIQTKIEKFSETKNLQNKVIIDETKNQTIEIPKTSMSMYEKDGLSHQEVGFSTQEVGYPLDESQLQLHESQLQPHEGQLQPHEDQLQPHEGQTVSEVPPSCNTSLDDMNGYESGELATF